MRHSLGYSSELQLQTSGLSVGFEPLWSLLQEYQRLVLFLL